MRFVIVDFPHTSHLTSLAIFVFFEAANVDFLLEYGLFFSLYFGTVVANKGGNN